MNIGLKISVPPQREWYSDETIKALKPLQNEIEDHNKKVDSHEQARKKAESEDIESLTSKDLFDGQVSTAYRFDLYKKAIELCDKVAKFSVLHNKDRELRYRDILSQLDTWKKKIREELTNLGYVEEALHQSHIQSVENFHRMHPEVQKLLHMKGTYEYPDNISGGNRKALLDGMTNLRKRCLLS